MTTTPTTAPTPASGRAEAGFSLIEVMVAMSVLLIVASGMLPMGLLASKAVENQGHLAARTTEYAQDKLEQLLSLRYADATTNTRVFPATAVGGSGLTPGGSADPSAPVAQYVDYFDRLGNGPAAAPQADWLYQRVWRVETVAGWTNLKRVTVTATVRVAAHGGGGAMPTTTVTALKSRPF